jgi:hypothetical protein
MYKQTKLHLQRYDWKVLLNRGTSSPGTATSFLAIHENRRTPGTDMNQLNESKRDMFVFAGYHRLTMFNYDDS